MERVKPLIVESDYVIFMNNFLSKELLVDNNNVVSFLGGNYDVGIFEED